MEINRENKETTERWSDRPRTGESMMEWKEEDKFIEIQIQ